MNLKPEEYGILPSLLIRLAQLIVNVYRKFNRDAGFARAGNLAYSTLLAAIPFAALVISLLNAFGALVSVQNQIMDFIVQLLIPTRQAEVKAMLDQFLENSNTLGVVGLVFFAITSIMLLNTINENLNAIWGSRVRTNFISKFTTYASVIIFGTLLVAASTTITSRINLFHIENIAFLNRLLLRTAPFIFDFFVILMLIGLTPSGKVRLKYVLTTSAIGAVFWELLKYGFFTVSSWAIRMSVIYGTIAVVPIFLFWIYIIWMIIISAMEGAWVLQHKNNAWMGKPVTDMSPFERLSFGLELFLKIAEAFDAGLKPPSGMQLASELSVSVQDITKMTQFLLSKDLLVPAGEEGQAHVPARSLDKIRTVDVIEAVFGKIEEDSAKVDEAVLQITAFRNAGLSSIDESSILDLIRR